MTEAQHILTEVRGRVGVITLNRPGQLSALNDALTDALGNALLAFDRDDAIGAIVITGNAKAAGAGADISAMADWSYMDVYQGDFITRNWEILHRVRKPVMAAVAGLPWAAAWSGASWRNRWPMRKTASSSASPSASSSKSSSAAN